MTTAAWLLLSSTVVLAYALISVAALWRAERRLRLRLMRELRRSRLAERRARASAQLALATVEAMQRPVSVRVEDPPVRLTVVDSERA